MIVFHCCRKSCPDLTQGYKCGCNADNSANTAACYLIDTTAANGNNWIYFTRDFSNLKVEKAAVGDAGVSPPGWEFCIDATDLNSEYYVQVRQCVGDVSTCGSVYSCI